MSDRIGILGESITTSLGTTNVYVVPVAKAARGRIMFNLQGNAGGATTVEFQINGMLVGRIATMTASFYCFSIKGGGLRAAEQAAIATGIGAGLTVAPADPIYYLNAGDIFRYLIGGATPISMFCQFVGTEIDV